MEWNRLLSWEAFFQKMEEMEKNFPELSLKILGKSEDDREIGGLFYGTGEKTLICCGGVHGRENVNPYVLLGMLEKYAGEKIKFPGYTLLFIPLLNPDGYEIARAGFETIRNPKLRQICQASGVNPEEWKNNARNVDINRNFPSIHYKPKDDKAYSNSEKETKVLTKTIRQYPNGAFLDFHSRGEIIYYYRTALWEGYNQRQYLLAKQIQEHTGYALGNKWDDLDGDLTGGNTVHFYSEYTKNPAITIETVSESAGFPIPLFWQEKVYEQVHKVPEVVTRFLLRF